MPLSVIGAGQPRTGTTSLKHALEQLGFGPCHHMTVFLRSPREWPLWERVWDGEPPDWEKVFEGYGCAVDAPSSSYYRELAEFYPRAKVILTHRDPDNWIRSVMQTTGSPAVLALGKNSPLEATMAKYRADNRKRRGMEDADGPRPTPEQYLAHFHRHNAEARRVIPPERLLSYDVKEGWEPLCRFLRVPVPATPFPRENTTADFQKNVRTGWNSERA